MAATTATFEDFLKGGLSSHLHFQGFHHLHSTEDHFVDSEYFPCEFMSQCTHTLLQPHFIPSLLLRESSFAFPNTPAVPQQ